MEGLFAAVNAVLSFVTPVSDFFWDFPKMFGFWQAIPLLGQFSLAIIVLVGSGLYFTFRLGFIQIQCFSRGVRTLMDNHSIRTGISPLAAFCLSTAMRVGPGNIIGVTGAIAAGGPGAPLRPQTRRTAECRKPPSRGGGMGVNWFQSVRPGDITGRSDPGNPWGSASRPHTARHTRRSAPQSGSGPR